MTPASSGSVLWRMQGLGRLTVVVKATLRLVHEADAELASPIEIVRSDLPAEGRGSLEEASETAPYLPGAGVLVRGHACAPADQPTTALTVRLALHRDGRWTLDKGLHVFGDRTREAPRPRPFQRIPIVYERAYGGAHVEANPVGMDAGSALPNVVHPAEPTRPAGLGPIARRWAPRRYFLGGAEEPSAAAPELDARFDFRYFNAAPLDQQIDFLRGDEWIFLQGMHPQLPWVRSRLPSARGVARLRRSGASGHDREQAVDLVADTLTIDADRLICSVVWRGNVALLPGDTPDRLHVLAGVELRGVPVRWPAHDAPGAAPTSTAAAARRRPGVTIQSDETEMDVILARPIAPFALAPPAAGAAPPPNPIPGAPWSAERCPPSASWPDREDAELTRSLVIPTRAPASGAEGPRAPSLGETVAMSRDAEAAPASGALPFVPAAPAAPAFAGAPRSELEPSATASGAGAPRSSPLGPRAPSLGETVAVSRDAEAAPASSALPFVPTAPAAPALAGAPRSEPEPSAPEPSAPEPSAPEPKATGLRATVLARLKSGEPLHDLRLSRADLDDIDFSGASLEHWNFAGSSLVRCKFERARLTGANLRGADLTEASFAGADLTAADLSGARLDGARLDGASLARADLAGARGTSASFVGASLAGADLRQARLPGAVFDRADLTSCPGSGADLSGSRFGRTNLTRANLRGAKLKGATLAAAIVDGADLRDADLTGATLHGVHLASARTGGAILRGVVEGAPPDDGAHAPSHGPAGASHLGGGGPGGSPDSA
ncbi:DUF2169 family type VI secretion system accessory protein [Sorangium sp. So ce131]|uniref:DUF2169 family type VI secretion system accessory protein n=1 Tax=Sorangium sp. So ce131 TaxID=3133282 RepID=UPI003F605A27